MWVESIVKAAVEGSDAARGIVEEVVDERHLVDDRGDEVVSGWVLCAQRRSQSIGICPRVYIPLRRLRGPSSLGVILATARILFPFSDIEVTGTFQSTAVIAQY